MPISKINKMLLKKMLQIGYNTHPNKNRQEHA